MASNPMQRKSRNSFLLGMIVTLVITGIIIAFLFLMLKQKSDELKVEQSSKQRVYTLAQDVTAGQVLTKDMFTLKSINSDSIPSDATSATQVIDSWFLQTKEGEAIYTDKYGLYLDRSSGEKKSDTIIEVMINTGNEFQDSKGTKVSNGDSFIEVGGKTEKVTNSTSGAQTDEYGRFFVDTQGTDKKTRVYKETSTDEYYIFRIDTASISTTGNKTRVKEYIDIKNVPILAKVDMNKNTVITSKLIVQSTELVTDDVRQEQFNMITLPIDLMTNDYIDIRLRLPSGQNFIVVSKTQVEIPINSDKTYVTDTIRVNLREDEILAMSSAIVEAYGISGAELYATKYPDPAMQAPAAPTYTPNAAVTAQMQSNPNIVEIAKKELATRYSEAAKAIRNENINPSTNSPEYNGNIVTEVDTNLGKSLQTRKKFLESLNSGNTTNY